MQSVIGHLPVNLQNTQLALEILVQLGIFFLGLQQLAGLVTPPLPVQMLNQLVPVHLPVFPGQNARLKNLMQLEQDHFLRAQVVHASSQSRSFLEV